MWRIQQNDSPEDYVVGTGISHTVKEVVEQAFSYADLDWQEYVEIDSRYFRPAEVDVLEADATRAREQLGWEPKVDFTELIAIMVDADMEAIGLTPIGRGRDILASKFPAWHRWDSAVSTTLLEASHRFE